MEYYYSLAGIVDEFIQLLVWSEDYIPASRIIQEHMDY